MSSRMNTMAENQTPTTTIKATKERPLVGAKTRDSDRLWEDVFDVNGTEDVDDKGTRVDVDGSVFDVNSASFEHNL